MPIVYVYLGAATFTGGGDFEWQSPQPGARHKLMLFLAQQVDESQVDAARASLASHGFSFVELGAGKRLLVETLNSPNMGAFQKHYEGALDAGCSVVWYPEHVNETAA